MKRSIITTRKLYAVDRDESHGVIYFVFFSLCSKNRVHNNIKSSFRSFYKMASGSMLEHALAYLIVFMDMVKFKTIFTNAIRSAFPA